MKHSTRMPQTARTKSRSRSIERRTSAWECCFDFDPPLQIMACPLEGGIEIFSTWYIDDICALRSKSMSECTVLCFRAVRAPLKVPRQVCEALKRD
jgi:hypothetical protein